MFRHFLPFLMLMLSLLAVGRQTSPSEAEDESPHKSGFVTANGVRLHYLDWSGSGDVLLLLAGFGDTAHAFDNFAPRFTDRYHVIGLTRRGFGKSDKPSAGYDTATRVNDILQFLDTMKIRKAHIVGHSIAGDEMTLLASLYPERLNKLVYLDAAYDRRRVSKLILADPTAPALIKRLHLEAQGSPEASQIIVGDMPPPDVWEVQRAMIKATITFRPDYRRLKAPALAFYATPERHPYAPPQTTDADRKKLDDWWVKNGIPFTQASIEQFRRDTRRGQVVELKEASHYLFLGRTQDPVVSRIREFLYK